MNKKPAKYLDKILTVLAENFDSTFTVNELMNKVEPQNLFGEQVDNVIFAPNLLVELRTALTFLESKNLIHYNPLDAGEVRISYEGYLKIRSNSFTQEINEKSINISLQRLAWVLPIIISFAALLVSIYKNSPNENSNEKIKLNHCQINRNVCH